MKSADRNRRHCKTLEYRLNYNPTISFHFNSGGFFTSNVALKISFLALSEALSGSTNLGLLPCA